MSVSSHALRALVVVPARMGREVVVRTLEQVGLEVAVAREPFAAMAMFVERPAQLIVIAIESLARGDRAFLQEVRRFSPDLRVLLLISESRRRDVSLYLEAGADAILPHPFFPEELKLIVKAVLREDARDPLTGLPNRAALQVAFERERARAERGGQSVGVALLDIDHFGDLNARLGYRRVDRVLQKVARLLRDTLRITDLVARWGGDEFLLLLTGLQTEAAEARAAACDTLDRLRLVIGAGEYPGVERGITMSGGMALWPHDGGDYEALFDVSNERLGRAKREGRNRIVCRDPEPEPPPAARGEPAPSRDETPAPGPSPRRAGGPRGRGEAGPPPA